jgi:hypothetical protein
LTPWLPVLVSDISNLALLTCMLSITLMGVCFSQVKNKTMTSMSLYLILAPLQRFTVCGIRSRVVIRISHWSFFGRVPNLNYRCPNADAGVSFPGANAQLCSLLWIMLRCLALCVHMLKFVFNIYFHRKREGEWKCVLSEHFSLCVCQQCIIVEAARAMASPRLNMRSPWRQTEYLDNLCRVGTADFLALT